MALALTETYHRQPPPSRKVEHTHPFALEQQLNQLILKHSAAIESVPQEWARTLLDRKDTQAHIIRIVQMAQHILLTPLQEYRNNPNSEESLQNLQNAYLDFFLLAAPHKDPLSNPSIRNAQQRQQVLHIARNTGNNEPHIWLPEYPAQNGEHRHLELVPVSSLNTKEQELVDGWWEQTGLLVHLVGATTLYKELYQLLQNQLPKVNQLPANLRDQFSEIDLSSGIISLWGHDIGRLVTHHRDLHATISQIILEMIGFKGPEMQDHELSTKHEFRNVQSGMHPDTIQEIIEAMSLDELLWYTADILSKLRLDGNTMRRFATFYAAMKELDWVYIKAEDIQSKTNLLRQAMMSAVLGHALRAPWGFQLPAPELDTPFVKTEQRMQAFLNSLGGPMLR